MNSAALAPEELNLLALYNSEVSRGIKHSAEYDAEMAALQERFNIAGYAPQKKPVGFFEMFGW